MKRNKINAFKAQLFSKLVTTTSILPIKSHLHLGPQHTFSDEDKFQAFLELLSEPNSNYFKSRKGKSNLEPLKDKINSLELHNSHILSTKLNLIFELFQDAQRL